MKKKGIKHTKIAFIFDKFVLCTEKEYLAGFIPLDGREIYETIKDAEKFLENTRREKNISDSLIICKGCLVAFITLLAYGLIDWLMRILL